MCRNGTATANEYRSTVATALIRRAGFTPCKHSNNNNDNAHDEGQASKEEGKKERMRGGRIEGRKDGKHGSDGHGRRKKQKRTKKI